MTKIKLCGMVRAEDALFAASEGADYLGFIFVASSPRCLTPAAARAVIDAVKQSGANPQCVGVFRDESPAEINRIASAAGLDLVQLHGDETDETCRSITLPVIKTIGVSGSLPDTERWPSAAALLFDNIDERRSGGTGRRFDWELLADYPRTKPFFLAGGINPDNVAAAISSVRPDVIDLASGVEDSPGIKNHQKIQQLFERVRRT